MKTSADKKRGAVLGQPKKRSLSDSMDSKTYRLGFQTAALLGQKMEMMRQQQASAQELLTAQQAFMAEYAKAMGGLQQEKQNMQQQYTAGAAGAYQNQMQSLLGAGGAQLPGPQGMGGGGAMMPPPPPSFGGAESPAPQEGLSPENMMM